MDRPFFSVLRLCRTCLTTSNEYFLPFYQARHYAARKGTREKARKKKVKIEIQKVGFIPHNLREKVLSKGPLVSRRLQDHFKPLPVDNVWVSRFYRWRVYDFKDAVAAHRETHHPDIYNVPDAALTAFVELDMSTSKKTKFVDKFTRMAKIPHPFEHGEDRSILVFCKTPEIKFEAETAGATLVGNVDLIKKIEKGDIVLPDFQFVMAHPNILPELVGLRGLLKKKFPNPRLGTLGADIKSMIQNFRTGIQYWALRDEVEQDYGWVDTTIGRLDMKEEHLEENLKALLDDIQAMRPKRDGPFITRVFLKSPPSAERFKLNLDPFIKEESAGEETDSDDEEDVKARAKS